MEASLGAGAYGGAYGGRGPEIMGVAWFLMAFTTIIILVRLYVRFCIPHRDFNYKDSWALAWAVLAWLFGIIGTSFISVAVHYGLGNHLETVLLEGDLSQATLYSWVWWTCSTLMIVWAKCSVVAFLIDIQRPIVTSHKWVMIGLVVFTLLANLVNLFLVWFQCSPARKGWMMETPGDCHLATVNYNFSIFTGALSAFVNLILALYPVPLVYSLQIPLRLKLLLASVLVLGVFTCVCACMRTRELRTIYGLDDPTYRSVPLALWSIAESWLVLIASGIPTQWPLLDVIAGVSPGLRKGSGQGDGQVGPEDKDYHSNRTSATNEFMNSETSTLNESLAGQDMEGAIAVKREVTIDREARHHHHGMRPKALVRSWAGAERKGSLARWSSAMTIRSPSWARGMPS